MFWSGEVWGQQCTGCSSTKTYNGKNSGTVTNGSSNWTPTGKINNGSSIPRFDGTNATYHWEENDLELGGVILANGADLSLDRGNEGNNPGFSIQGGCIVIGSGSTLSLVYITELTNVTICVEDGGKLILDSRESSRNDFTLSGVEINLQGPNSELVIGEADIFIGTGGVNITGWTGDATDLCPTTVSGVAGSSGNISWTSDSDGSEICKILNANAGCGPAGCDVIVNGNTITGTIQNGATICIRGNRSYAIDLQNRSDLTICVASGVTFSGFFTNYNTSNKITVNVYGTVQGDLTLNNSQSSFNVFSSGRYNNYGTLNIQNGTASNQGTVSNSINVNTNSSYFNSGTQSGQVTLNNSSVYTSNGTQSGQVIVNNSSTFTNSGNSSNTITLNNIGSYNNSGIQSGNVTMNHPNTTFSIASGGSQTGGVVTINDGSFVNNGSITRPVTVSGTGSYINNNTHIGNLSINGSGSVTNNGTLNISTLSFDTNVATMTFNNSSSSTLNVTNSTIMAGTISLNGTATFNNDVTFFTNNDPTSVILNGKATFNNNLTLLANNGSNDVTLNIGATGGIEVTNTLSISRNGIINLSNDSNLTPLPYIIAGNLTFRDAGGRGGILNARENTEISINQTSINGATGAELNIYGNYTTNSITSGGSGGKLNLSETGKLSIATNLNLDGNLTVDIAGELSTGSITSNGSGGNSIIVKTTGKVTTTGDININGFPFSSEGMASIRVGNDLKVTSSGQSKFYVNDNSDIYVSGNTTIDNLFQINDDAFVTFQGSVNVGSSGSASLTLNDNADILIQSNLTKTSYWSGSVIVNGSSQLVICDQRRPSGSITGSYPEDLSNDQIYVNSSPAYYGGCRILPVEFLNFSATYQSSEHLTSLNWSTGKEWENSHFEIERAINTVREWEVIGRVEGNGYSDGPVEYSFEDLNLPLSGGYVFYRIKQVDIDGSYSYSNTRSINIPKTNAESIWKIYPNPTSGQDFNLRLFNSTYYSDELIQVRVVSVLGNYKTFSSYSISELSVHIGDYFSTASIGIYTIEITWGNQIELHKIIRN